MKKIAIFVEGQTEQIFVKQLIHQWYGYQNIQVVEEKIRGPQLFIRLKGVTAAFTFEYYFLIIDVGCDEKVASAVRDNAKHMLEVGYDKIIGLRDLYRNKRAEKDKVLQSIQKILSEFGCPSKLKILLAIMEIEAWFLGDPGLFQKIDALLTPEYIEQQLGYDLSTADPEIAYDHPAEVIERIYKLVGKKYGKHEKDAYQIAHHINYAYLCLDVKEQKKIPCFFLFLSEIAELD